MGFQGARLLPVSIKASRAIANKTTDAYSLRTREKESAHTVSFPTTSGRAHGKGTVEEGDGLQDTRPRLDTYTGLECSQQGFCLKQSHYHCVRHKFSSS